MSETTERNQRKERQGVVVSDVQDKTIVVRVERRLMHPIYKKFIRRSKKYAAHDETNLCREGDMVAIEECRPISKTKSWVVIGRNGAAVERPAFGGDVERAFGEDHPHARADAHPLDHVRRCQLAVGRAKAVFIASQSDRQRCDT